MPNPPGNPLRWAKERLITGQKLLKQGSHFWADQVFSSVVERFEKAENVRKKTRDYIRDLVIQAWTLHARSLLEKSADWILTCDAYQHAFFLLSQYQKYDQIANMLDDLIRILLTYEQVNPETLATLLESAADMLVFAGKRPEALEFQLVVMLLRGFAKMSERLTKSLIFLERTLVRLRSDLRNALVVVLLENAVEFFKVSAEEKAEFIEKLNGIAKSVVPVSIKDAFSEVFKVLPLYGKPEELTERWTLLSKKLQDLNEYDWALRIYENLLKYLDNNGMYDRAVEYGKKFIILAVRRQHLEVAYRACQLLCDILASRGEYGTITDLWGMLSREFSRSPSNRHLFNLAVKEMEGGIVADSTAWNTGELFSRLEDIWLLKTRATRASEDEFWSMVLHRAVFEEGDLRTGALALGKLSGQFKRKFHVTLSPEDLRGMVETKPPVKAQYNPLSVLRLSGNSRIELYGYSMEVHKFVSTSVEHAWDDTVLQDIYRELVVRAGAVDGASGDRYSGWTFKDLGRCLFLMLPKPARDTFLGFKAGSSGETPSVLFLMDEETIPIDFLHDGTNFLSLKYATGNKLGEPPMMGIGAEDVSGPSDEKNVLLLGDFNASSPKIWNDALKKEEVLYPFPEASENINHLIEELNQSEFVNQIAYLQGNTATRAAILETITSGQFHVIYLSSNLFFVGDNPQESYFLTSDNEILSIREIKEAIASSKLPNPLVVNDSRFLRPDGEVIANCTHEALLVAESLEPRGAEVGPKATLTRIADIHHEDDVELLRAFLKNLLGDGDPLGVALLKARQQHFTKVALDSAEKIVESANDGDLNEIAREGDITGTSFVLYGFPWMFL
ncbi:MAG: hypothetical protein ACTSU5_17210 [Promethearchaeota archaeon]